MNGPDDMSFSGDLEYQAIFDKRGALYHTAMRRWPEARRPEFENLIRIAGLAPGQRICDVPAGGGYLADYLQGEAEICSLETTAAFVRDSTPEARARMTLCDLGALPVATASMDRVISLAGMHHVEDKIPFFREARRILLPDGVFCVADVHAASPVRRFLDDFVGGHNETGHSGWYFDASIAKTLALCGLAVESAERVRYDWVFDSPAEMAAYCKLLFGMLDVDDNRVVEAIGDHLGFDQGQEGTRMRWELFFVRARPETE